MKSITLGVATSAYNEADNLHEFWKRTRFTLERLKERYKGNLDITGYIWIADNCSSDNSLAILSEIVKSDPKTRVLSNATNYGGEPSSIEAIKRCREMDYIAYLCSDLQDPPELIYDLVVGLLEDERLDATFAVKSGSDEGSLLKLLRAGYYRMLGFTTRGVTVPRGFHGFGVYTQQSVERAMWRWDNSDMTLRTCFAKSAVTVKRYNYKPALRRGGKTKYSLADYFIYALTTIFDGEAVASRISLLLGFASAVITALIGTALSINYLRGSSGYASGTPTIMLLVAACFTMQYLIVALLARSVERGLTKRERTKVSTRVLKGGNG